jgi:hypothetical protein
MRQTISGLIAAVAVMTASAVPAMACGGGLFQSSCSPCGQQAYVSPCEQAYVPAPVYSGCDTGCGGGWAHQRLADPVQQYYYANQGPTYSGPGSYAPYPTYRESTVSGWGGYRHRSHHYGYDGGYRQHSHFRPWRSHRDYGYSARPSLRYGYAPRQSYAPRYSLPPRQYYAPQRSMRYGAPMGMPRAYGHERMMREHMRRYN